MTHQYQTLVREITTPSLPTFIMSCLNLVSYKSSNNVVDVPSSLRETIFRSFSTLLPRHSTIYRPFISQIRLATRPFIAPTSSDGFFASRSLKEGARQLSVLLHQTATKNAGGEEWGKAVRDLIQAVHETADHAFRAIIEDWESATDYNARPIDINQPLKGGGQTTEDLPSWSGIYAGVERIIGMLELLSEYFRCETSTPVAIPLGSIMDMVTRILSIAVPQSSAEPPSNHGAARLHPAIDRDERDGLWSGMPQIYAAALQLISTIAERMEGAFLSISQSTLDQLAWVFPFGKHSPEFRLAAYNVAAKTLFHIGQSLDKPQVGKLSEIIRLCCRDLQPMDPNFNNVGTAENSEKKTKVQLSSNHNADTFLRNVLDASSESRLEESSLFVTAGELLPMFLSHIPQQYLDISLRSVIERTAILTHNKSAMLASILNPFVGKNGKAMTSILPHLTRGFSNDDIVEILLRPRMPLIPSVSPHLFTEEGINEISQDEEMDVYPEPSSTEEDTVAVAAHPGLGTAMDTPDAEHLHPNLNAFGSHNSSLSIPTSGNKFMVNTVINNSSLPKQDQTDVSMDQDEDSSGNESVHLTMQLDTDSDSDG
jgi:pre-rRNA-processing protein RIX1